MKLRLKPLSKEKKVLEIRYPDEFDTVEEYKEYDKKRKESIEEAEKYGELYEKSVIETIETYIVLGIVGLFLIISLLGSFKSVKAGYVGIITRFGKVDRVADSGLVLKLPFVEKVVKMDTRVQKQEAESSAATKDLQDVTATIALNYAISKESALEIYNNLGTDYAENIITPVLHESFKASASQYTAEDLIKNRTEAKEKTLGAVKERLSGYGIQVTDLNIVNLSFSAAFNSAIEAKAVAQQQVETARQELEKAKVEAEKVKTEAQAQAEAQRLQQDTLSDLMVKKMWIDKWDGQLPSTMTDDAGILIGQ